MNKKLFLSLLLLIAGLLSLTSCEEAPSRPPLPYQKYENVVRVVYHGNSYYTVYTQTEESPVLKEENLSGTSILKTDVPVGESMWAERLNEWTRNSYGSYSQSYIIHIHNPGDINPAGWDHGKGGHGQNSIIE